MKKLNSTPPHGYFSPCVRVIPLRPHHGYMVTGSVGQVEKVEDNPNQEEEW